MKIAARFVTTAATARDFPEDGLTEVALVGRSNVGKSSLINALVRQRIARTSTAPGKTRLANIYRVARESAAPFYLVDLPGYGFARGRSADFARLVGEYFGSARRRATVRNARSGREASASNSLQPVGPGVEPRRPEKPGAPREGQKSAVALFLVDSRHPGLQNDVEAWRWLGATVERRVLAATKIDKLARGERIRALRALESVFEHPVLPVSAVTGEGLDELWKLIDELTNSGNPQRRRKSNSPPRTTAPSPARK